MFLLSEHHVSLTCVLTLVCVAGSIVCRGKAKEDTLENLSLSIKAFSVEHISPKYVESESKAQNLKALWSTSHSSIRPCDCLAHSTRQCFLIPFLT